MIAQILRQTAAVQIPKNSDCQAYPVYLLLHRKLFRITIDMKRKKKSMFKWYLSVIPILINIPLISEAQNTVSEEHTSIPDIKNNNYVELDEVVIVGKSEARRQQEQAFAISVADLSKNYNTSVDIGTITNRMAGVKLRVNGGVGSDYNFTLNGFSGRQVKFFMDGLAMDNFGDAFSINNLPANMVERVEVYKGVLPVGLGADALGGAVNVITRKTANYLDVSYSFGSFNTHKASINGAYTNGKTGLTTRLTSFLNYSDNNYKVYVPIIDLESGQKLGNQWVKRFHDGYKSLGVRLETGFVNRPFADYLLAGIIVAGNDKDIQNGVVMELEQRTAVRSFQCCVIKNQTCS